MFIIVAYGAATKNARQDAKYVTRTQVLIVPGETDIWIHGHRQLERHAKETTLAVIAALVLKKSTTKGRVMVIPEADAIYGVAILRLNRQTGQYEAQTTDAMNGDVIELGEGDFFCIAGVGETTERANAIAQGAIPFLTRDVFRQWRDFELRKPLRPEDFSTELRPHILL